MTNEALKLGAFTPEAVAKLTPEARATFTNQLIASGHDKGQVEKALTPADGLAAAPAAKSPAAVENLRKHWTGDPAALETGLKKAGIDAPVTDERSREEKAFDGGFAVPEPSGYRLNYTGRAVGDPATLARLNGQYQEMFSAIALPGLSAQGVLDSMLDSQARFANLKTDYQKRAYQYEQRQTVERLGADMGDLKAIMGFVGKALDRVKDQEFVRQLIQSGAMSAAATLHMARQGQRLVHREQLAAKRGQK